MVSIVHQCRQCAEAAALEQADPDGNGPVATRERARAWLEACRGDSVSARQRIPETVGSLAA